MKTESLLYPYDSVFNIMPVILKQRGCAISSMNSRDGIIKATHKSNLFHRENGVQVKVDKVDNNITLVTFWVNSNEDNTGNGLSNDLFEEKILRSIHRYF